MVNKRIGIQIGIWAFIFWGLPYIVTGGQLDERLIYRSSALFLGAFVIIPLNLKILFPTFYFREKPLQYLFTALILTIGLSLLLVWIRSIIDAPDYIPPDFRRKNRTFLFYFLGNFFPMLMVLLSSALYEISIVAAQSAQETAQLKSEKLESELKFLKSQINPHFLFNSLNNIYTLTMLNPNAAGESVLKLSEMLRYLLYECDAEKVPLCRELAYLTNYIALFSLKDDEPLNIKFDITNVQSEIMIAPLLLIPFVENAFKHSQIEDLENGWINIKLSNDNQQVYFEIKNSLPQHEFAKDKVGGIGLNNVKRQLELVYPNKHTLKIEKKEGEFSVELTIKN
ncbi:MAG: sensor histidine kinase [Saprospiraceae bacterium]